MRYLLMIHGDEAAWDGASEAERSQMYEAYGTVFDQMRQRGHLIEADELTSASTASLVRVRDGATTVMDGPFTETKEQIGGYFLVECDLDTAIGYAAAIPRRPNRHHRSATGGSLVRRLTTRRKRRA